MISTGVFTEGQKELMMQWRGSRPKSNKWQGTKKQIVEKNSRSEGKEAITRDDREDHYWWLREHRKTTDAWAKYVQMLSALCAHVCMEC